MKYVICAFFAVLLGTAGSVAADTKTEGWIFTPVVGVNRLALDSFFDLIYNAPFVGSVRITTDLPEDVEGESAYPTKKFYFENSLQRRPIDVEAGLEMRRRFGTRSDFFVGIAAWETAAEGDGGVVVFPLQGQADNRATYVRRSKLSYTQYFLGLRQYLTSRTAKFNYYFNLSLREIFDIDYEEANVFEFISGAPAGFKRIFIYQSQATGLLMLQFGAGAEFQFAERFSVALEGAYAFHIKDGAFRGVKVKNDFNDGDGIRNEPFIIKPVNPELEAGAVTEDGSTYEKVNIRLDGWHVLAKFNISF